jgi:serine phosphatase RsbU (regulator of sigma subunit)
LRAELEAAREVQQQLVTAPPATPSFRIESAYVPATQVGGDFYRILPSEHGDILVVVGDVSGKGLRAAMTVSAIIGSLRTLAACEPASVLRDLNRSLAGQLPSGFVTCLAARLRADGNCSIANAGHLAPYRRGEEISLPSGLPLGITADADYPEIIFQLAAGDTLTFLSDGVVEAQTPSGELFGFDRTRAISSNSAQSIADAAVRFGQEDDITVLTVEFAPDVAS